MPDTANLATYDRTSSAVPRITLVAVLPIVIMALLAWWRIPPFPEMGVSVPPENIEAVGKLLFLAYLCNFAAMWMVYFASRWKHWAFRTRTLRLLLHYTSVHWGSARERVSTYVAPSDPSCCETLAGKTGADELKKIEGYFQDKARTSMTTLGMLIAVAALELAQANSMHQWELNAYKDTVWSAWILGLATLAAVSAFVMFIVSVDSLDSLFNRFDGVEDRHILIDHFYRHTINLRYFGLVCLLLGAVMLIAFFSPWLAATALGMIFVYGYNSWFPKVQAARDVGTGQVATWRNVLRVSVIAAPLVIRCVALWYCYEFGEPCMP